MTVHRLLALRPMLVLILSSLILVSCDSFGTADPGAVLTAEEVIELGAATSVDVAIDVNTSADLMVADGSGPLLSSQFTYNERLEPDLSYEVDDGRGVLEIDQPRRRNLDRDKLENEWNLRFGSEAPVDLSIDMSSGDTELQFSELSLASLEVDTSSGNLDAVLQGQLDDLRRIDAATSSGNMDLTLDGVFQRLEMIELDESSGNIDLTLGGEFNALQRINIDSSSGNTTVRVAGNWTIDLLGTVDTSSGNVTLVVPADIGVRISADVSSGNINADGFRMDGGDYVNDAFGTTDVSLEFEIDVSSGNIILELSE